MRAFHYGFGASTGGPRVKARLGDDIRQFRLRMSQNRVNPFLESMNMTSSLYSRLAEAKNHYLKVLEIEPRHAPALAFLGMVHHLMDQIDQAIVRYHEVCLLAPPSLIQLTLLTQALSIDPLNSHALDLLNLALEAIAEGPPFGGSVPGGEATWRKMMREQAAAATKRAEVEAAAKRTAAKDKHEKPPLPNPAAGSSTNAVQDVAMADP